MSHRRIAFAVGLAALVAFSGAAAAPERAIVVRNDSRRSIVAVYVTSSIDGWWDRDLLRGRRIDPNDSRRVRLRGADDGGCNFDVRLVDDRRRNHDYFGVDLCLSPLIVHGGRP
jgi:hypothetical protein